jgi:hypothetical protein
MATYYKYKSREGEDQIDWRGITQGITDDMNRIAKERADKKEKIDNEVLTTLETLADKPQGQDAGQNQIIANYAEQASAVALANQKLLKSGAITLKEYTARTNTAGSSTKKLFNLSKKYQENYQKHMDSLKPDENGKIQGSGLGALFLKQVETFSNPDTTRYYMDPTTGEAFLAKVGTDKTTPGQVATIDGQAYSLMDVGAAGDIISRDVNRYQSNDVATNLAEQAGTYVDVIMTGDVKTKEDAFARMFKVDEKGNLVEDGITEEGKAIMTQIKATFASDMDYASMLYDTMGYQTVAKNTKGEGYTNLLTGEEYKEMPEKAVLFETVNGQQQPQITEDQKKEAEMGVLKQIRTKLDIKETARADTRMTDWQRFQAGEINRKLKDKEDSVKLRLDTVSELYRGGDVNLQAATTFFRDISEVGAIQDVERNEDGVLVTYINDAGETKTKPLYFYNVTRDDDNNVVGINKDKPLTERDFIKSAANFLLGTDSTKSKEFINLYNRRKSKDAGGGYVYDLTIPGEGTAVATTETIAGTEETKEGTFNIAFDTYLDQKLTDELFGRSEGALSEDLMFTFTDMGLKASPSGTLTSELIITVPGYTGDPLTIDANNQTEGGRVKEKEKLKKYLRQVFKQRPDLSDTLKIEDKDGNEVPFTSDPVRKNKGFG